MICSQTYRWLNAWWVRVWRSVSALPVALAVSLLVSLAACVPPELGDSEAALALEDMVAGTGPSRLKEQTPEPTRHAVEYTVEGRQHSADVYLSPHGARAGIVLVPGVVAAGKDDHRLVALAYTLARLRFAVVVPEIPGLRQLHTRAGQVREVADAFRFLLSRPEWVPDGRAGLAGFSYGVGIVTLAALEPDIREQVRYIVGFGGYYDMRSIVTYFTTGYFREGPQGRRKYREPHRYLKWVFTMSNSDLLERPQDRAALQAFADQLTELDEAEAEVGVSGLAPDARALYALLTNERPERVSALVEQLSPRLREELEGINPAAHDLAHLKAKVILLHGRGDNMIPYTESMALARALPRGQASLFLIDGYAHTEVRPTRNDLPQLLAVTEQVLAQRVDTPEGKL